MQSTPSARLAAPFGQDTTGAAGIKCRGSRPLGSGAMDQAQPDQAPLEHAQPDQPGRAQPGRAQPGRAQPGRAQSDRTDADWDGASYDRLSLPQARWGRTVMARLDLEGDETVLDAGCGSGRVTEELLERLPRGHVVALDASPSMLAEARARLAGAGDKVTFVEADSVGAAACRPPRCLPGRCCAVDRHVPLGHRSRQAVR